MLLRACTKRRTQQAPEHGVSRLRSPAAPKQECRVSMSSPKDPVWIRRISPVTCSTPSPCASTSHSTIDQLPIGANGDIKLKPPYAAVSDQPTAVTLAALIKCAISNMDAKSEAMARLPARTLTTVSVPRVKSARGGTRVMRYMTRPNHLHELLASAILRQA